MRCMDSIRDQAHHFIQTNLTVGFSTIDLMGGKPTLDAVIDSDIEAFYTKGCVDRKS